MKLLLSPSLPLSLKALENPFLWRFWKCAFTRDEKGVSSVDLRDYRIVYKERIVYEARVYV